VKHDLPRQNPKSVHEIQVILRHVGRNHHSHIGVREKAQHCQFRKTLEDAHPEVPNAGAQQQQRRPLVSGDRVRTQRPLHNPFQACRYRARSVVVEFQAVALRMPAHQFARITSFFAMTIPGPTTRAPLITGTSSVPTVSGVSQRRRRIAAASRSRSTVVEAEECGRPARRTAGARQGPSHQSSRCFCERARRPAVAPACEPSRT